MVAVRWGHIHIVTRKWLAQSVTRKACLNEEAYPVQDASITLNKTLRHSSSTQHGQDKSFGSSASFPSSVAAESSLPAVPCAVSLDADLEATLSQKNMSSMFSDPSVCIKEGGSEFPAVQAVSETDLNGCVANDSQSEDNDLYLSECRISLVGFEASTLRKLVGMVRRGGGSRYMSFNDKLTHIIVGIPSEAEKKEVRGLAASGVINVVRTTWLEDCDREKKEMPVLQQHIAYDLILPKDSVSNNRGTAIGITKGSASSHLSIHSDLPLGSTNSGNGITPSLEKAKVEKPEISMNGGISLKGILKQSHQNVLPAVNHNKKDRRGMPCDSSDTTLPSGKSSTVFKGKIFRFSKFFPEDRKAEIIEWVGQGGGEVVHDYLIKNVHFIIECHGVIVQSADVSKIAYVSSHWIRSCLEEGCLLDVGSHIIYSPVPCQIPLPGFENFRFCISQYEEKDRLLLRNLCFVLGSKFVEKLTRKVTHLLCKFKNGPKYEAACKWGICSITCEWIYECIRQNKVVAMDPFRPKEVTSQDDEAGLCVVSQFPVQAGPVASGEFPSQLTSQSQDLRKTSAPIESSRISSITVEAQQSLDYSKKARLMEDEPKGAFYSRAILSDSICNMSSTGPKDNAESSHSVPDVAAAIEDLLEQTSKIHEKTCPGRTECDKSLFPSDCSMLGDKHEVGHAVFGFPKQWLNRTGKKDELTNPSRDANGGIYDGFSETQTESQVVGYEEDLSGRQMLIDRVRTRSSVA